AFAPTMPRAELGASQPSGIDAGKQPAAGQMAKDGDRRPGPDDDAKQAARRFGPAGEDQGGRLPKSDGVAVGGRRPGPKGDAAELRLPGIAEVARQMAQA